MSYTAKDIDTQICTGDYITDGGDTRLITGFEIYDEVDAAICFADGGLMGIGEVTDDMILLESEVIL